MHRVCECVCVCSTAAREKWRRKHWWVRERCTYRCKIILECLVKVSVLGAAADTAQAPALIQQRSRLATECSKSRCLASMLIC